MLTSLITMYSQCNLIESARKVFDENPQRNLTVCFNALISGYAFNYRFLDAAALFCQMREMNISFNSVTMLGLIPACNLPPHTSFGMSLHGCIIKFGLDTDSSVGNCLLTMYAKCGSIEFAKTLFDSLPKRGLISWNAMISGYAQNGLASKVLDLYRDMKSQGIHPDPVTLVCILSSCAHLGAYSIGREVEREIELSSFGSNSFLSNALINMYSRCGKLAKARAIFDAMPEKTVVTWTAVMNGYGIHGQGEIATQLFDDMIGSGIKPDGAAFVSILSACSHAGLTDKGLGYFDMMKEKYCLRPGPEHYSCLVDLLGRAGKLDEAFSLIRMMKVKPDGAVWGALLGACKIHKNVELAELAFKRVIEHEPENVGYYVLLSNIYNEAGDLEGVLRVRVMMRDRNLRKEPGYSYVEHRGKVHLFVAGERNHPQIEEIYRLLNELESLVEKLDYLKKNEGRNDKLLSGISVHSERLAIAFGILNSESKSEIIVIKNLRMCTYCHSFVKSVSEVVDRRFVVRDATRFHHFSDGICSCRDYW